MDEKNIKTLTDTVETLRLKIENETPMYRRMPLVQQIKVGTGEVVTRPNPWVQEFRATVKDYINALNNLESLTGGASEDEDNTVAQLRQSLRLVK